MTNEAVCIEKSALNDVMRTCADAVGLEKGTLVWLDNTNTISGASIAPGTKPFGGITTAEKVANDGSTRVSCAISGVWDLKCTSLGFPSATGQLCVLSGSNLISGEITSNGVSGGCIVGKLEEVGSASDTIRVRLLGY